MRWKDCSLSWEPGRKLLKDCPSAVEMYYLFPPVLRVECGGPFPDSFASLIDAALEEKHGFSFAWILC